MTELGNLQVEAADIGLRMRMLPPTERVAVLKSMWTNNHFCWGCGRDYIDDYYTCGVCEKEEP